MGSIKVDDSPLYLVSGGDEYLVSTQGKALVEKLCPPEDQGFGLEIIEARCSIVAEAVDAVRRCVEALQTIGFLGGRKVVWLKDANFLAGGVIGQSNDTKEAVARLTALIKSGIPPGETLVVTSPKVDRRSAFFKACQSAGQIAEYDVPEKSYQLENHAREVVSSQLRKAGISMPAQVMEVFLAKTGTDTRQIVNEIEKLSVYLGDRKEATLEDIRDVVCASRDAAAWDLADAVGNRDLKSALRMLRQLAFQGENEVGMIIGLENRFREIVLYRECLDRRWVRITGSEPFVKVEWRQSPEVDAAMSSFAKDPRKTNPWRAGRLAMQARKFSAREAARCQTLVLAAHETLFSISVPKILLLEFLILRLLGAEPAAVR